MRETTQRAAIHPLAIPTSLPVGPVNVYVIDDDPLTLVDTGPGSATALVAIEEHLATLGHAPKDLGRIVLTHHHPDHMGLAGVLAARTGAEVVGLDALVDWLVDYETQSQLDDQHACDLMLRHGADDVQVGATSAILRSLRVWGSSTQVDRPVRDGESLEFGNRSLRVLRRPGHSEGDTVFYDEIRGILFGGDHLLAGISSNAVVTRSLSGAGTAHRRSRPLMAYRRSLQATMDLDPALVLGGHGPSVSDVPCLVRRRLREQGERAARLLELLEGGPQTAYELALGLMEVKAQRQTFLAISEVLGHLDLLLDDGVVEEIEADDVVRFAAR